MYPNRVLRNQVRAELKKKRYIVYTLLLLSLVYVAANLFFGDMSAMRYRELGGKKAALETQLKDIREQNNQLEESIKLYRENDFYVEKNARENFGLSGPDEYIFIYKGGQQGQCRECGRADGKTFAGGGGGVAQRV